VVLPVHPVCERHQRPTEVLVEPAAASVERDRRRQACPQARQRMGTLPGQAKGREELVIDSLHDLAQPGKLAPQAARPGLGKGLVAFGGQSTTAP